MNLGAARSPEARLAGRVVLLPTGACEAHGPHLPLDTDVRIAVALAERVAARVDGVVLPPLPYGVTRYARNFPGTLSIEAETVTSLVEAVLRGAHAAGARKLVVVNAHFEPANVDALFAAVKRLEGLPVVFPHLGSRRNAARLRAAVLDGHAGIYETSLVLAVAPQLVQGHAALPENPADLGAGMLAGATCFEEAGGPDAYFGRPAAASAAIGEALYAELTEIVVEAIGG